MPEQTTTTPATEPKTKKAAAPRAEQDQRIVNNITGAEEMIALAGSDATAAALLAKRGYDAAKLAAGNSLRAAAQTAFEERRKAMSEADAASAAFTAADGKTRQDYSDFRVLADTVFESKTDKSALGITGRVAADQQMFITAAKASYKTAKGATFLAKLGERGYKAADFDDAITALEALPGLHATMKQKSAAAELATTTRNSAHDALLKWVGGFRKVAKVALRAQPAILKKMKL